jgi:ring-1,2-phenylacetyl-CoA epoxidase subunit PaaC
MDMNNGAVKELLYKMADDLLILGHRNSEWTGLGPMLEEDIAFSSMAQDKIGQSLVLYEMLHELGEADPDTVAFTRNSNQFHNCQFVELPIGEYNFSLVRQFLFDYADWHRWNALAESSVEPISYAAKKFRGEIRYHTMHAKSLITKLGNGTEGSVQRLQSSLDESAGYALGIFEKSPVEDALISEKIFIGEEEIKSRWIESVNEILKGTKLSFDLSGAIAIDGGRVGTHTEHLQPLLDEMSEVFRVDPTAEW